MASLLDLLQPQDIDLKVRIMAAYFENPFLDTGRAAMQLRFDPRTGNLERAVQDLERCGVFGPDDERPLFCPEPGSMEQVARVVSDVRTDETRTRGELAELAEVGRLLDQLSVEREEVARILEMVPGGVLLVDRFGQLIKGNADGRRLTGLSPEGTREPVCRRLGLDPEDLLRREVHVELDLDPPVAIASQPFRLTGSDAGAVILVQDISERRALESQVEKTREAFFSMIRHELRRPLMVLERVLSQGAMPPEAASNEAIAQAADATAQLTTMVDDMLLLARLERDPVAACQFRPVSLGYLLAGGDLTFRERARSAGVVLEMVPAEEDVTFLGDPGRLAQVVSNLVENALRFTPPGGTVTLSSGGSSGMVALRVSDTGVGIPEEELERIFDRFHQAQSGDSRPEGLGLGLAICRLVVGAHGGTIQARNRDHGGAEFLVRLPLSPADGEQDGSIQEGRRP